MLYLVMCLVPFIWRATVHVLCSPPAEESTVDAWIRQQARVKEAIARAKLEHSSTKPADVDDE